MMTPHVFLQGIGLSPKEIQVYLTLLGRGPSSVRQLAAASDINRGTTYDVLKTLQDQGLVSFYHKEKKQFFIAEEPNTIQRLIQEKKNHANSLEEQLDAVLPQLRLLANQTAYSQPVVRYYHGHKGMKHILVEVLQDMNSELEKKYFVYSSSDIAQNLYHEFPDFTDRRIENGIRVDVISIGPGGSTGPALSERRWLSSAESAPTYTIIFGRKVAFVSLDDLMQPHGVILDDLNVAYTQKLLFEKTWNQISSNTI